MPQLRRADLVVCVSREVAAAVEGLTGRSEGVMVTPCVADAAFFEDRGAEARVRSELGLGDDAVLIGWAGSFRRFHAIDDLLRAFFWAATRDDRLRLVLVGDGPDRGRLEALARDDPMSDRVHFTRQVPYSAMPDYVAALDVTVVTAHADQPFHYSPPKLREYRAAARAVIAPAIGQVAETVRDGVDGLLYEPGDVHGLADRLLDLAADPTRRRSLGMAARADELAQGGASAHIDQVLQALEGRHG